MTNIQEKKEEFLEKFKLIFSKPNYKEEKSVTKKSKAYNVSRKANHTIKYILYFR